MIKLCFMFITCFKNAPTGQSTSKKEKTTTKDDVTRKEKSRRNSVSWNFFAGEKMKLPNCRVGEILRVLTRKEKKTNFD